LLNAHRSSLTMRVIGTAGHVDHGKSTLVKALTRIDPDRLAEEKARQMTIDLGFAWMALPDGEMLGIVDVPGHRDFIENMLAGVGGIDAAILVIAADEGIMPQTREHLAILDLLGIRHGLVALTKIDLIDDPEWLELIRDEIRAVLQPTQLSHAEIVGVSAYTGQGIPQLIERLIALLADLPLRPDYDLPRLPIDRVFTISGFGTVVTGTLIGGSLRVGDEIELQPSGLRGRIRGLQSYKQAVEVAAPGSRAAVNVVGIERPSIRRGDVLTYPGILQPTTLIDVHFRHLPDVERPLKHNATVKIFSGAAEANAHVRLLTNENLPPGGEGWLQLRLDQPIAVARGDRFILRYPSPGQTIGGGIVVEPYPPKRWKRFQPQVTAALELRLHGTPAERIVQAAWQPIKRSDLQNAVSDVGFDSAIREALESGLLLALPENMYLSVEGWGALSYRMMRELATFHRAHPLRLGMPREELRSRIGLKNITLTALLDMQDQIAAQGTLLQLADHAIRFDADSSAQIEQLRAKIAESPYTPPSFAEAAQIVGEEVLHALIDLGEIVQVQPDVIFSHSVYKELVSAVFEMIDTDGGITAGALRDRFGTSRKYAIGLLEYLDAVGKTRREGDVRVRGRMG
jgi:selenocysteine-specific elongation factor